MQGDLRSDLTSDPRHTEHADTDVSSSCLLSQGKWPLCDLPRQTKYVYDEAVNLLKVQCHESRKIETELLIESWWFSQFLAVYFWRESNINPCMLLWNHLLIVKILPVTLLRGLVPAFRKQPVILKIVPKVGHECTQEKINQWERRKAGTEKCHSLRNNL